MARNPSLFPPPDRHVGPHERSLNLSLRAWRKRRHLTGDDTAAARSILRELARAADRAAAQAARGDVSDYSAAVVIAQYRSAHDAYAPPAPQALDPAAEQLAAVVSADLEALADE